MKITRIKRKTMLPVMLLLLPLLLLSCRQEPEESVDYFNPNDVSPVITQPYTLSLNDRGEVVADVDYVVCIDIGDRESFRILNFADIHIVDSDVRDDSSGYRFMKETTTELVAKTQPDMITLTGDQTFGYRKALVAVCDHVNSFGIPWAPVFGNHDCEQNEISLKQQSEIYRSYSGCLFMDGPENLSVVRERRSPAIGNYVVNLVKVTGDTFRVVSSLIFMNTGSNQSYDEANYSAERYAMRTYASLNKNQLDWFSKMAQSVQPYGNGEAVPSTLIFHMPIFAYVSAVAAAINVDADAYDIQNWVNEVKKIPYAESSDPKYWREGYEGSSGVCHEFIGGPAYDDGVFQKIKETGTIDMVYVGHEHINNINIRYQGVNLIYSMKTGINAYYEDNMIGGTLITVYADGSAVAEHVLNTP